MQVDYLEIAAHLRGSAADAGLTLKPKDMERAIMRSIKDMAAKMGEKPVIVNRPGQTFRVLVREADPTSGVAEAFDTHLVNRDGTTTIIDSRDSVLA